MLAFRVGAGGAFAPDLAVESTNRPANVAARTALLFGVLLAGGTAIFGLAVGRSPRRRPLLGAGLGLIVTGGAVSLALQGTTATRYALAVEVAVGVAAAGLTLSLAWEPNRRRSDTISARIGRCGGTRSPVRWSVEGGWVGTRDTRA